MIRILTDSTADITPDLARQWQVEVVPLRWLDSSTATTSSPASAA